jgi:hypothetical protein
MKLNTILNGALAAAGLAMASLLLIPEPDKKKKDKKKKPKHKKPVDDKPKLLKRANDKQPKLKQKKVYHVLKTNEGWTVQLEGSDKTVARGNEKKEAIAKAKDLVKQSEESQLVIHKSDGSVKNEPINGLSLEDKSRKDPLSSRQSAE